MAWRSLLPFLASALAAIGFGCANVKVHKVPVADRVAETDNHVKGFRYYLNRPYLAVARKVPISTTYIPAALAAYYPKFPETTSYEVVLISQIPKDGRFEVYDGQGQLRREIDAASKSVVLIAAKTSESGTPPGLKLDVATKIITEAFRNSFDEYVKMKKLTKTIKMDPTETEYSPVVAALIGSDANSLKADLAAASDNKTIAQRAVARGTKAADDLLKKLEMPAVPTFSTETTTKKMVDDIVAKLNAAAPAVPKSDSPATATAMIYADSGQTDSTKDTATTPSSEAFQVAFLPDFEEQYAIHNCNFLAVTKYKYTFRNGTELVSMAGSYDATDVPVKILETVGKLVEAAGAVGKAKLGGVKADLSLTNPGGGTANFWIRTERAIEPGLYRIQKSWERVRGTKVEEIQPDHACGLLSDVGLPIVTSISVISKDQHDKEIQSLYK